MDILTYIIAAGNLTLGVVIGIVIAVVRNVDDYVLETESTIKEEFRQAYTEFSNTIPLGAPSDIDFKNDSLIRSVDRLKKLHYSACIELPRIKLIERILRSVPLTIGIIVLLAFMSAITGNLIFKADKINLKILFSIIIPVFFLILEWLSLVMAIKFERYLKRVNIKYKKLEY